MRIIKKLNFKDWKNDNGVQSSTKPEWPREWQWANGTHPGSRNFTRRDLCWTCCIFLGYNLNWIYFSIYISRYAILRRLKISENENIGSSLIVFSNQNHYFKNSNGLTIERRFWDKCWLLSRFLLTHVGQIMDVPILSMPTL